MSNEELPPPRDRFFFNVREPHTATIRTGKPERLKEHENLPTGFYKEVRLGGDRLRRLNGLVRAGRFATIEDAVNAAIDRLQL